MNIKPCKTVVFYIGPKSMKKEMSQEILFTLPTELNINLPESVK